MYELKEVKQNIQPVLKAVEKVRKREVLPIHIREIITSTAFVVLFIYCTPFIVENFSTSVLVFLVLSLLIVWWINHSIQQLEQKRIDRYKDAFGQQVVSSLIQQNYPNAQYHYQQKDSVRQELENAQLQACFPRRDHLKEYISGVTNQGLAFRFGKLVNADNNGMSNIYLELQMPQQLLLNEPILLLNETLFWSVKSQEEDVKLADFLKKQNLHNWDEDAVFGDYYFIRSNNNQLLSKVLTPALLGALYNLWKEHRELACVSITQDRVYVCMSYRGDWLDTDIKQSILSSKALEPSYQQLCLYTSLLEDLGRKTWQPTDKYLNDRSNDCSQHLLDH